MPCWTGSQGLMYVQRLRQLHGPHLPSPKQGLCEHLPDVLTGVRTSLAVMLLQDAKAFMVSWKDGEQVVDAPKDKLNINPFSWLGITTAAGLYTAAWFVQSHTEAVTKLMAGAQASRMRKVRPKLRPAELG